MIKINLLFLPSKILLYLSEIKEFGTEFEGQGECLLESLPILLQFSDMPIFEAIEGLAVLGFHLGQGVIPVLVELLVFHDVGLLYFFTLSCLVIEHFLSASLEILSFELFNAVFSHFSL